ncbi:MAG TPA: glycoside hydrolase family 2 TIM barrel-domain containing protein [Candidatus Polarisedimenticolia bacterium]|nr:glycoside hydrolase family 2 TIM barrel-domain containing protein [Candidatus Polarisedimenticolia bacterium]
MPTQFLYPRPEYPRPDRQRGTIEDDDWLNLNGPWQFRFDDGRGIEQQWFAADAAEWREQIIVPFCWESLAAWGEGDAAGNDNYYATRVFRNPLEVTRENHRSAARYEIGWYRRLVEIPQTEAWNGKRVILTIGAADFFTDCWCNGKHLGHHEGGYTPFEFDLTDSLVEKDGKRTALIVLRVEDPMDNREQPVGKQWRWYTTTSGIWQTVFVEPRSETHIKSFKIVSDIDKGTAEFTIQCAQAKDGSSVEIEIVPPGCATVPAASKTEQAAETASAAGCTPPFESQTCIAKVKGGVASATTKLNTVQLWDPNSPNLYSVRFRLLSNGMQQDCVRSYFGMRKVDFDLADKSGAPAALRLNGVPRYLRGALHQSFYPDGVYTASSVDVIKNDIARAKEFGFNFLRIHIKIDDPLLYYWADKLGMLLMADFPNFGEGGDTTSGRRRFEQMVREGIERDFNHPSIFAWCLFNETWGFGGQMSFLDKLLAPSPAFAAGDEKLLETAKKTSDATGQLSRPQEWVQGMWELAKQLDPTRLVEDMSVCHWDHLEYYQHCDTDINSWHFYISDYQKAKEHIAKIVKSTFIGSSFNYVPGFQHKGQPLINSEYGGIGALDGDRDVSWSFKFLTNELRRYQQIAAYIYTELHDVEWEYNGFLNYDRTPKDFGYDPRFINESNTLPIDSPPIVHVHPGETVRLEVASSHFSTRAYRNVSLHWEMGGMDTRGRVYQDLALGRAPIAFPHRKVAPAHTLELKMPDASMLCTLLVSARTADGIVLAQNFVNFFCNGVYPSAREEFPRALVLRGLPATWENAQWEGEFGDRDKSRAEDSCYGFGHGYFEWKLPLNGADISKAHRLKVVCEASSHRIDSPQTDADIFPTTMQLALNDVPVYHGVLRNHPHDARGVLSYLRGGVGAYGYLVHAFAEGDLLRQIAGADGDGSLRLRCGVPTGALPVGGLTIYGAECGRYPVCPTVIVEW